MSKTEFWTEGKIWLACIVVCLACLAAVVGPAGASRALRGWSAKAYGSDWLVVQYTQSGSVISSWELHGKSVGNETSSDGIYFTDDTGNVVHLSGHYVYVEVAGDWAAARSRFLPKK